MLLQIALALSVSVASAAGSPGAPQQFAAVMGGGSEQARADEELWWHHAVVYQVYPRSFMDSNGDGVGDLNGITSRLEHLQTLGVGALWLSPFYPSPQADFGYDISNYKDVDPQYGTLADFKKMVDKAHSLGMKVVVDLVPNHSSDEHEWFEKSVKKEGKYADYYIWRKGKTGSDGKEMPPNNWKSLFRGDAWQYNEERGEWYFHQFAVKQPDLNYNNNDLVNEIKDVFTFWMNQGVDGFRVDALPFLFEENYEIDDPLNPNPDPDLDEDDYNFYLHPNSMDREGTYDMLQQWREVIDKHPDGKPRVMMTECYTNFENTIRYYGTKERPGAHFTFNFQIISYLSKASNATDFKNQIDMWMQAMEDWRWPNWVIGNHDNSRVATRFPNMADAMNMLTLTLPGTAMSYQGEELGATDAFISWAQTLDPQAKNAGEQRYEKVSRDKNRTPMQWDDTPNAGFSTAATTWLPTNPEYWTNNVKLQTEASKSHMKTYTDLTALRKTLTMQKGTLETRVIDDEILFITRAYSNEPTYVTVINFGSWIKSISANDVLSGGKTLKVYAASDNSALSKGDSVSTLVLRPKAAVVLTTADVKPDPLPTAAPNPTDPPPAPKPNPTNPPSESTTKKNGASGVTAAALVTLVAPLLLLF